MVEGRVGHSPNNLPSYGVRINHPQVTPIALGHPTEKAIGIY
jgi:hypothetical protein